MSSLRVQVRISLNPKPLLELDFLEPTVEISQEVQSFIETQKCDVFQAVSSLYIVRQLQVNLYNLSKAVCVEFLVGVAYGVLADIDRLVVVKDITTAVPVLPTFHTATIYKLTIDTLPGVLHLFAFQSKGHGLKIFHVQTWCI